MIKTHMNNMKKYLSLCIMLLCLCSTVMAQQEKVVVKGVVTDEAKEPLIGVNVTVKDMPGLGSITDMNGHYSITMEPYRQLVFTYIGYESKEVMVKEQRTINVVMKESVTRAVDEVVITGTGVQRKLTQTGAITTVDVGELKRNPSSSIVNALAGNVPGIMARQTSGQPGKNISEFWIRGISTFGANSSAYVLVDGFERSMDEINIEDIETFTVLKDASATAIYGSKGANGVVLITTKRGKAGKIKNAGKILYLRLLDSLLTEINLHIQKSTPGGIRTPDTWYRKPLLYPLSYECAYSYASFFPAYIIDLSGSFSPAQQRCYHTTPFGKCQIFM